MSRSSRFVAACFLFAAHGCCGFDLVTAAAELPTDYRTKIKSVFAERCFACHGALKQEAGLRLDTAAAAIESEVVVPGAPDESVLLERVSATDMSLRMPPEGEPLTTQQVDALRSWISEGAVAPSDEAPESDPMQHWAFQTPVRPGVPAVESPLWNENPIDAFIANDHQLHSLKPQPIADKRVWLRRVMIDLVGLPPTKAQLDAFVADSSPSAYEAVVDQLLVSPQYGERWGRHWMDIWRYSDWWGLGEEVRSSQKHMWHWRDWIVQSLNEDKGYDQMLREMLAADELYPNDFDRLRASGFLARQYFKFNRTTWMDQTIEHTSKAMLGLTFNCAKCHDHKFDPIAQTDYYQMRAIFEPYQIRTDTLPGEVDVERDGIPRAFDCNLNAVTYLHIRGEESRPDEGKPMQPSMPGFLSQADWNVESVTLPPLAAQPGLRPHVVKDHLKIAEESIATARKELETAMLPSQDPHAALAIALAHKSLTLAELQPTSIRARAAGMAKEAVELERRVALAQAEQQVAQAELDLARATEEKKVDAESKRSDAFAAAEAARVAVESADQSDHASFIPLVGAVKTLESNIETEESRRKPFPKISSGRRSALAIWMTDPKNPLPARVAVNHIWMRHFGVPLVATVFDFGRKGTPPTHPELLNWLAVELIESGWSMKHLHRLIVTSQTYRLSSSNASVDAATWATDPGNVYYWRANPTRMQSEVIRDSLLHLAGELDRTYGGPSIPTSDETSRRRSLYFVHSHNEHQKFLSMFDDANVLDCYRRDESIVPQQALALENSVLAAAMANRIAANIKRDTPDANDDAFIRIAFETVLSVEPSEAEMMVASDGLERLTEISRLNNRPDLIQQARTQLIHALLNHNDFVTVR